MKASSFLKMALLTVPFMLSSCFFHKKTVVKDEKPVVEDSLEQKSFLQKVKGNAVETKFITSKVKFSVEVGPQNIALTGNLKMKRDDVIRLQLMAFGFVEAGRIEFTKDYVLIMDRINKLYLKAPYIQIDFLRNSGLNFYSLQALFWNELFQPNKTELKPEDMQKFTADLGGDDVIISLDDGYMGYSWLASDKTGQIHMANIFYKPRLGESTQLNWDYRNFATLENGKTFPDDMAVTLTTAKKEVKLGVNLKYIGHETEWETRTEVSNKYQEVTVDEILRRFMAL